VARSLSFQNAVQHALRQGPGAALFGGDLATFLKPALGRALTALVDQAGADPRGWRYGKLHTLTFRGPLAKAPVVGGFFESETVEASGAYSTVHAEGGIPVEHGSVLRLVVELTEPPSARLTIDTGQSGYPRTPHAMDQFPAWNAFDPPPFPTSREAVEASTEARLTLLP
jgi:penicillin amidase